MIPGTVPELAPDQLDKRIQVRMRRQERVNDPDRQLRLWVVLDESALRRVVGSHLIMREQLEYLVEVSLLPHVTVQVLPYDTGAHAGMSGTFSILEFDDAADSSVVYIEGVTSDLYLEKTNDVHKYTIMYEHLRAQALNADKSRQFIADTAQLHADAAG